eukprot:7829689-Alexandrium_andersonii.AAC.1
MPLTRPLRSPILPRAFSKSRCRPLIASAAQATGALEWLESSDVPRWPEGKGARTIPGLMQIVTGPRTL